MVTTMQTIQGTQEYLWQPEIFADFEKLLGRSAKSYIQGALMVVSESQGLQECTPTSVYHAALEAASLGLSFDKSLRQAYLIPRNISSKIKGTNGQSDRWIKTKVAQFKPHYNGLYNLADWTGNYRVINVSPVYKGEEVYENPLTGLHMVQLANGLLTVPNPDVSGLRRVTNGERGDIVGWLAYYKTHKGLEKSVYMSISEIEKHARVFSDSYKGDASEKSLWDPNSPHRPTMEMKTVFRKLANLMDLSGERGEKLRRALLADDAIDAVPTDVDPLDDVTKILVEAGVTEEPIEEVVISKALPREQAKVAETPDVTDRLWTVAQKKVLIDNKLEGTEIKLADNDFAAKGMLGLSSLPADATEAEVLQWGTVYRTCRSSIDPSTGKKYLATVAAAFADEEMLALKVEAA